jgi:hypothetical protein
MGATEKRVKENVKKVYTKQLKPWWKIMRKV